MPQIDVTTPLTSGLNALSSYGKGVANRDDERTRHGEWRASFEAAMQARAAEQEYRGKLFDLNARELDERVRAAKEGERLAGVRLGDERDYRNRALGDERDYRMGLLKAKDAETADYDAATSMSADVSGMLAQPLGADGDLEKKLADQRANVMKFASGLSPRARAAFLRTSMPDLINDEQREREGAKRRGVMSSIQKAMANPDELVSQGDPEAEEIQAIVEDALGGLEDGSVEPGAARATLAKLRDRQAKKITDRANLEEALNFYTAEKATAGSVNADSMNAVWGEYVTSEHKSLPALKSALLNAKHGLTVKVGSVEVPTRLAIGSKPWRDILESEADSQVTKMLADDPLMKQKIADGEFKKDPSGYLQIRERLRRSILRGYAGKFGVDGRELGWDEPAPDPKAVRAGIDAKLKAAGIDPNTPMPKAPKEKTGAQVPWLDRAMMRAGQRVPPGVGPEGEYNEKAIEDAYGPDEEPDVEAPARTGGYEDQATGPEPVGHPGYEPDGRPYDEPLGPYKGKKKK